MADPDRTALRRLKEAALLVLIYSGNITHEPVKDKLLAEALRELSAAIAALPKEVE